MGYSSIAEQIPINFAKTNEEPLFYEAKILFFLLRFDAKNDQIGLYSSEIEHISIVLLVFGVKKCFVSLIHS